MAAKRRKQSRKAVPREADAATPQTRAKLKRDTVAELAYQRKIDPVHEQAAREISSVFTARTVGLHAKIQDPTRAPGGTNNEDWRASLIAAAKRYDEWANKLSAAHHNGAPPLLEVAISIIIDGRTGNEVDTERRQRKGTACKWLTEALAEYVRLAGWNNRKAA